MTIPIFELPALGFEQVSFDLIVPRAVSQMRGRRTETWRQWTPYWQAEFSMTYQTTQGMGQADAWIRKLLSRGGVFRAHDEFRPRPIEAGQTPLTWAPVLTNITDGGQKVSIAGVGANFQFREGDYVSFQSTTSSLVVSLHSIAEDAKASASGTIPLTIDPPLDTQHFKAGSVTVFEKPHCLMQPFDWSAPKSWSSRNPAFSAQEVFFYETP